MIAKWPAFAQVIWKSILDWWDSWIDYEVITIVWLLAQVTIILGPPVTFGVYYAINVLIRTGDNVGIKGVLQGAKTYFWRGLAWGVINWVVLAIGVVNISFYGNMNSTLGFLARMIVFMVLVFWVISQFYALPFFMAQEEEKILPAIRNGFFMAMASPLFTLGILIFALILVAACVLLILPAFFGFPVLFIILGTRALYDRLETFGLRKKDIDPREVR